MAGREMIMRCVLWTREILQSVPQAGGMLTGSITHSCVERCSNDADVEWLIWCRETLHVSEVCKG
jgi:hypothetical protein